MVFLLLLGGFDAKAMMFRCDEIGWRETDRPGWLRGMDAVGTVLLGSFIPRMVCELLFVYRVAVALALLLV